MTTEEAIKNLTGLINAALKNGLFGDVQSVGTMQISLDTLAQAASKPIDGTTDIIKEKDEK
jgi:hypothetical protein